MEKTLSRSRERLLISLSVAISVLLVFAVAEVGLRIYAANSAYILKPDLPIIVDHAFLGKALKPNSEYASRLASVSVNSRGFRGKDFDVPKPAGVYRAFALGGSTTFGFYPSISSDAATYPGQLELLLNEQKPSAHQQTRFEVINGGLPGYSLRTSLQNFAARALYFQPDAVLIYHNTNDLARYGSEAALQQPLKNFYTEPNLAHDLFESLFSWSYVLQELRFTLMQRLGLAQLFTPKPTLAAVSGSVSGGAAQWQVDPRYPAVFRRDLTNLVVLAKANGVLPVLISQSIAITAETDLSQLTDAERAMRLDKPDPYHARIPPAHRYQMFALYNDIIREVATAEGAIFVDANAAIPKTPDYHWDYCHLTDRGAALLASTIHQTLLAEPRFAAAATPAETDPLAP